MGPLLYHFADMYGQDVSFSLSSFNTHSHSNRRIKCLISFYCHYVLGNVH